MSKCPKGPDGNHDWRTEFDGKSGCIDWVCSYCDTLLPWPFVVDWVNEREALESTNIWMRREIGRAGRALFSNAKGDYTGTDEDLHSLGATVEGVCEMLATLKAENARLKDELRLERMKHPGPLLDDNRISPKQCREATAQIEASKEQDDGLG